MADVMKTEKSLKLLAGFVDEDDRTITLNDPRENLTWDDIDNFASVSANVLIGDKYAAAFSRYKTAKYVDKTIIEFDLGNTP